MIDSNIHIVWIDLDDTLWDFKANSRIALGDMYRDHGLSQWFDTPAEWIECYEHFNHQLWDQYNHALITKEFLMAERFRLPLAHKECTQATELSRQFDTEYLDRLAECTLLVPGAIELLVSIRQRDIKTGILSNGFTEVQFRKIRNSGLEPYIDYVVLSDQIGINKPDVRIFRHAEVISGIPAAHSLMIGDNPDTDILGAINAGWQAILYSPVKPPSSHCPIITDLHQALR